MLLPVVLQFNKSTMERKQRRRAQVFISSETCKFLARLRDRMPLLWDGASIVMII